MPLTLVQLLAARGLAQVDLQAAEARRVKLGGGLETSLLELGVLEEAKIGELWSEASRLPRPPPELLKDVSSAMASLFPQQLAERYGMVPLGLVRRQLSLLARHPVDLSTLDEISFLLSRPLKLFVGTELEIAELLGTVYGVAVAQRLKELRLKLSPSVAPASVPAEPAPAPSVAPAPVPADVAPASVPTETAPAPSVAPAPVPADNVPAEAVPDAVSIESALASMASSIDQPAAAAERTEGEQVPITLPPKRSLSPEPWSINLPLREPPSASRRAAAAAESAAHAAPQPPAWGESAPQVAVPETVAEPPQVPVQETAAPELAFEPVPPPAPAAEVAPEPQPAPATALAVPQPEPSPFEATPLSSRVWAKSIA